jgi:hypothetical protein
VECAEWLEKDVPATSMVLFRQDAEEMQKMDSFQGSGNFVAFRKTCSRRHDVFGWDELVTLTVPGRGTVRHQNELVPIMYQLHDRLITVLPGRFSNLKTPSPDGTLIE